MRMRPVPLLSPAATTRRRTHALVFNFASVGREALLDGRFAPEAVVPSSLIPRIAPRKLGPVFAAMDNEATTDTDVPPAADSLTTSAATPSGRSLLRPS